MPGRHWDGPLLALKFATIEKVAEIDEDEILSFWTLSTKCKNSLENGPRLENISWRLWYRSHSLKTNHPASVLDASEPILENRPTQIPTGTETKALTISTEPYHQHSNIKPNPAKPQSPTVSSSSFTKLLHSLESNASLAEQSSKKPPKKSGPESAVVMLGCENRMVASDIAVPSAPSSLNLPCCVVSCDDDSSELEHLNLTRPPTPYKAVNSSSPRLYFNSVSCSSSMDDSDYDSQYDFDTGDLDSPCAAPIFVKVNPCLRVQQLKNRPSLLTRRLKAESEMEVAPGSCCNSPVALCLSANVNDCPVFNRSNKSSPLILPSGSLFMCDTNLYGVGW